MTAQSPTLGYGAPVPTKLLPPQQSFVMTLTETSPGDLVILRAAGLTLSVLPWNSKGTQSLVSIWRAEIIPASLDVGTAKETVLKKASRATEVVLRPNIVKLDSEEDGDEDEVEIGSAVDESIINQLPRGMLDAFIDKPGTKTSVRLTLTECWMLSLAPKFFRSHSKGPRLQHLEGAAWTSQGVAARNSRL